MESVTWDIQTHKLVWVVQKGSMVDGQFVPTSEQKYEIAPDDAIMAYSNEKRGFTKEEAEGLNHLLNVLSVYCAESVIWWDQGQGTPVGKDGQPAPATKETAPKSTPQKVGSPQKPSKSPRPIYPDELVAQNHK
jgi:hypothetical protein